MLTNAWTNINEYNLIVKCYPGDNNYKHRFQNHVDQKNAHSPHL